MNSGAILLAVGLAIGAVGLGLVLAQTYREGSRTAGMSAVDRSAALNRVAVGSAGASFGIVYATVYLGVVAVEGPVAASGLSLLGVPLYLLVVLLYKAWHKDASEPEAGSRSGVEAQRSSVLRIAALLAAVGVASAANAGLGLLAQDGGPLLWVAIYLLWLTIAGASMLAR